MDSLRSCKVHKSSLQRRPSGGANGLCARYGLVLLLGIFLCLSAHTAFGWTNIGIPGAWSGWSDANPPWLLTKVSPPGTPGGADWFTNTVYVAASGGDTTAGTYEFKMRADQAWTHNWGGATVNIDATTALTYLSAANATITVANGNYYSFRVIDPPTATATIGVLKTSARPVTVTRASQIPVAPRTNDTVTVNITLGAAKSPEERIFVRWTTNNFATSHYVEASGSGTSYSAVIPALPAGVTNRYYVLSTTVASPSDATIDYLTLNLDSNAGNNYSYVPSAMPWPGGPAGGYASHPAGRIHHFKEQAVFGNGFISAMLDLNGTIFDIYFPSAGFRQGSGTANEGYRGPEEFPNCPSLDKQADGQMNVIAGMVGIGLARGGTNSIHWLKNQVGADYTAVGQKWLSDDGMVVYTTNKLNITANNILVQQYDFIPSTNALPIITDCPGSGCRTNYGVYIKRVLLTNLESTTNTVDVYFDINYNIKGANIDDVMYWETTVGGTNYNAMIAYDNTARNVTGTGCGPNGYGDDGFGNFDAGRNYNPSSFSPQARNASVYFATVMKLVTNSVTGAGVPADGSWRDHTATDHHEGWIGKRVTLPPGQTNEVNIMIVGSWDDFAGATGTHNFWGRRMIHWFYNNNMATVMNTTENYWSNWVNSAVTVDFPGTIYEKVWKRSLLVTAVHLDNGGAIIAGFRNGAYQFCWPRDGHYGAVTLARTGHTNEVLKFFRWLRDIAYREVEPGTGGRRGAFYQKYTTDGYKIWTSPQVDETSGVPWAFYNFYSITGDATTLTNHWTLIKESAIASTETNSGIPEFVGRHYFSTTFNLQHSNNLWEDQDMLSIYSNGTIVRGLRDAAHIAEIMGEPATAASWRSGADNIQNNGIIPRINANVEAADISLLGLSFPFEVFAPTNAVMTNIIEKIHGRQSSCGSCPGGPYFDNLVETSGDIAGLLRRYNRKSTDASPDIYWGGGPWFLSTSWYGQYYTRWQDYVAGKTLVTTNLTMLDKLISMMDSNMLIGAEQISPVAQNKYPGFRLQAAWPNVWESHSMMVDQMLLFGDIRQQASNNTVAAYPKFPIGWTNMTYYNVPFRGHNLDFTFAESKHALQSTTNVLATINKKTSGAINTELHLRVPVDQITNANHVIVALTNEFPAGASSGGFISSVNSNTGAIRITGPLTTAALTNAFAVYPDTEKQGVTDFWKAQHGFAATVPSSSNMVNGMTMKQAYLAGVDPTVANTRFAISNVTVTAAGTVTVTWRSLQDGTTVPRLYDVYSHTGPFTNGATWSRIASNLPPAGVTTALNNDASGATVTQRFFRVTIAGRTNDVATPEIVGVHRLSLVTGRNYISMSMLPGTNTLLSVLGTNQLPQGTSESTATVVDIWDQTAQVFTNTNRYWLDVGTNGWKQSNTAAPSNGVLLDPNKGMIITIRTGSPTLRTVGFVPTNSQIQVVFSNGYSLVSSTFPRPIALADSGLIASGFVGGNSKITSDVLYFFNPSSQQFDDQIWLDSNGNIWRNADASVATRQIRPGEAFLIRRRARTTNMIWTNPVPYIVPFQAP